MSDTEEVVIPRRGRPPKNTKPEIAREKLKEKRERLKKEKEEQIIQEAKVRLAKEAEDKIKAEADAKAQEEEKKKNDPMYSLNSKLDRLVDLLTPKALPPPPPIEKPKPRRQAKKATIVPDSEDEEKQVVSVPTTKPKTKVQKEPVAPKVKAPRKPRKKNTVYEESPSNNFVGTAPAPPSQPLVMTKTESLLNAFASRRGMNTFM
jgi:hypothetical protein